MEIILHNPQSIKDYMAEVLDYAGKDKVWLFIGEMGAGKTTTIKSICQALKVEDEVTSPTFSIVNEYLSATLGTIYHFDCYRLESDEEAMAIGMEDYLYSNKLCMIEWPQKIENILPENFLLFSFEKIDEKTRKLTITRNGNS